jgi:hypothetical protein
MPGSKGSLVGLHPVFPRTALSVFRYAQIGQCVLAEMARQKRSCLACSDLER